MFACCSVSLWLYAVNMASVEQMGQVWHRFLLESPVAYKHYRLTTTPQGGGERANEGSEREKTKTEK